MSNRFKMRRPKRHHLDGMSYSELKTFLKRRGHKLERRWATSFVSYYENRRYRFRWWSDHEGFVVDMSCTEDEFDRWANSCERTVLFKQWKANL